ncbi:PSD1 and planctomycete cytochrome C domain-containing protein [Allorhodopirellula heiligendammensis]|uniref:Planctomycete cytochrome C n=1 Tax=Allorhodopirellula heiligendammensis TaxID=2714739 RepID=A0A5C6BFP4_9BACT|nr:PSD1 and planctomycete cytochrome C domain-containing protein [Allorhodopirellula heiligendammensis]TWU10126.1 Planctomycete cytochrome C [Allorhodopirellula heiligendammensis]
MNIISFLHKSSASSWRVAALLPILATLVGRDAAADDISFGRDIRPLISEKCFACHGPDEESREAGLRLDRPDGDEGALNYAIEPGSPDDSEVFNRISTEDDDLRMPPSDSHLKPLTQEEQSLIRRWIEQGGHYEEFWAFSPPVMPEVPATQQSEWSDQPIDAFVLSRLEADDMQPAAQANPRTLLRRLTFDLTGLPPTLAEIDAFLAAYEKSPENAWEACVDRLISRPEYGEHMARYWLDLVRFADTNGMHKDFYRNNVAYRDWVIRAFNDDLPYDDFVRYQLAGDLYPDPTDDQLIASAFNRLHLIIDVGTALPEESQFKNVVDRITAVSTAFMGLTVQCAQCHDHKFDPITQKDFYALYAFFDNIDAEPETKARPQNGLQPPFVSLPTPAQRQSLEQLDQQIASVEKQIENAEDEEPAKPLTAELNALRSQREQIAKNVTQAMVMKERSEVRPTFIRNRGLYDALGEQVMRNTPEFLPPLEKSGDVASRMDLAEWFVDSRNPLTARVAVNRFWQQLFGVGLVKTSEDFGNQGGVPSHPELLDYLTVSFVEAGWDVKALVKQIVMSHAYRQASEASPEVFSADPENRLLARGSRYRLDAEMVRDQILATSGLLSDKMYGPAVKPPQPAGLWKAVSMTGEVFHPDAGDAIYRRSVYTFWKRAMPPPQMTILNAPNRDACIARRERTNTPLQALLLLNEPEYLKAAGQLAVRTLQQPAESRLDYLWETVTAQLPDEQEQSVMQALLDDLQTKYRAAPELAANVYRDVVLEPSTQDRTDAAAQAELAAWTMLTSTLYNLDITKTKD